MTADQGFVVGGARVFDGSTVLPRADVAVRGGRITAVTAPGTGGVAARRAGLPWVDGRGHTLLPGLIDSHVHAFPGAARQALVFGVTTQLDMFCPPALAAALRRTSAEDRTAAGIRSAGTGATAPGGHPWWLVEQGAYPPFPTVRGPQDAETFVAERLAEGSDYLKVIIEDGAAHGLTLPHLDGETVAALARAAHARERLVVAHISTWDAARLAVRAGVDVLGHAATDAAVPPRLVEELRARRVAVVPTLAMVAGAHGDPDRGGARLGADSRVTPYLAERARRGLAAPARPDTRRLERALTSVGALHAAGVPLLAGTDAPNPGTAYGVSLHAELRLLVRAGLSPVAALAAATSVPARTFGLRGCGRIRPGRQADLLLVAGDPTRDIACTLDIAAVWRHGVRLDRAGRAAGELSRPGGSP